MKRALPWDEQVDVISSDSDESSSSSSSDSEELNFNDGFSPKQSSTLPIAAVHQPNKEISSTQGNLFSLFGIFGT